MSLFKSYPTVSDVTIPLSLLPLWTHVFRCKLLVQAAVAMGIGQDFGSDSTYLLLCILYNKWQSYIKSV